MRTCTRCGLTSDDLTLFVKARGSLHGRANRCKQCANRSTAGWQARNKAEVDALKNVPCADCGVRYPSYVMDFEHPDGSVKGGNVSALRGSRRVAVALEEARKCDVVCSNCHRVRTHQRGYPRAGNRAPEAK